MKTPISAALAAVLLTSVPALAAGQTKFWNLTAYTVTKFQLAPAGSTAWGPNQTANDRDGTVDHDERLKIIGIESGRFDVKLADAKGRVCIVQNVAITVGEVFSIEEAELKGCKKK